ncbi:MAG: hypothetical protein ACI35W_05550, partial [Anaeroplasmataceae bacterium]
MVNRQVQVLNKRVIRECRSNVRSYVSIILITILCVSLFTGLFTNYHHFKENIDDVYAKSNIADIFATVDPYGVDKDSVDETYESILNKKS